MRVLVQQSRNATVDRETFAVDRFCRKIFLCKINLQTDLFAEIFNDNSLS